MRHKPSIFNKYCILSHTTVGHSRGFWSSIEHVSIELLSKKKDVVFSLCTMDNVQIYEHCNLIIYYNVL